MDDNYYGTPRNPLGYALISLFCGIVGTAVVFGLPDLSIAAAVLGAAGMVIGGFAIGVANRHPSTDRIPLMLLAGAGVMMSVISFMLGFVHSFG
jgi:hypothetical protein